MKDRNQRPATQPGQPDVKRATDDGDDRTITRPTRPPTPDDFIIDRDKTDPLRRFRF